MGGIVNTVTEIGTFGLVEDVTGLEAGQAAAGEAARLQSEAALAGEAGIQSRFEATQETLRPSIEAGDVAREQQLALLGLRGPEAAAAATATIQESPAQQFLRKRAQRNLLQNASAIGGIGGGNVRSALVEQGAGFASQDLQNQFARLQGLSAPGTQTAVQQGAIGSQAAGQAAQLRGESAAAAASGILGQQQLAAQTTGQIIGAGTTGLALLSDENFKCDIEDLSPEDCYEVVMTMDLKAWRYLESVGMGTDVHFGPMAQDAPDCIRAGNIDGMEMLDLHDELILIAGAIQFMKNNNMITVH